MKNLSITLMLIATLTCACTKEDPAATVIKKTEQSAISASPDSSVTDSSKNLVQAYFHISRVAKIHIKHFKDESGKDCTKEIIDEISDRLYMRCNGSCIDNKVIYDLDIVCNSKQIEQLTNRETMVVSGLNDFITCIDNTLISYDDPVPIINVKRFEPVKTSPSPAQNIIYNHLLNSFELIKLSCQ